MRRRRTATRERPAARVGRGAEKALARAEGVHHAYVGKLLRLTLLAPEIVEAALELELADGAVVADAIGDRACVFLAGLHRAERAIAARLRTLAEGELPWPAVDAERAVPWVEAKVGLALADSQREALRLALGSKVLVITGGPGVGKTTLVSRS